MGSWRCTALAAAAVVLLLLGLLAWLVGFLLLLVALCLLGLLVYVNIEVLLGRLAGWGIGRIPQAFRWTIKRISIRPSFSKKQAWSEIVVYDWTWHNPVGFDGPLTRPDKAYLLKIDKLRLVLKLSSIYTAVKERRAVEVKLMQVHGLQFNTQRNREGVLNLWQALDLPDDDVNVRSITRQASRYGGLEEDQRPGSAAGAVAGDDPEVGGVQAVAQPVPVTASVVPLPPVATASTRRAAQYWRPEWGERPPECDRQGSSGSFQSQASSKSMRSSGRGCRRGAGAPEGYEPLLDGKYVEYPIGDPRRRPRWGVPIRFDIHRVQIDDVQLWVLDLLTMDAHKTSQGLDPRKTRIDVKCVNITRGRLEAGDERRSGVPDGVHGVYLGELVWVIIAEVTPLILKRLPRALTRTAALAAAFAVKDGVKRLGAHAFQAAHSAGHAIKEAVQHGQRRPSQLGCHVQVHLISGRQVTRKHRSVNAHALLQLLDSDGRRVIAEDRSEPQMWTKVPHWDENFELGPASSADAALRVTLYHRKPRQVVGITHSAKETPERFIGEVVIPLKQLLIRDPVIAAGGEIVGWFPLTDVCGKRRGIPCSGQLKLGLRLTDAELLGAEGQAQAGDALASHADFAILQ